MPPYRHSQPGYLIIAVTALAAVILVVLVRPADPPLLRWIPLGLLATAGAIFSRLIVDVTAGELRIQFAPGWPRWRWRLSEIASAHPVRNPWIAGWGIHWMPGYPGYWVINVSGFDAVELRLRNGRRYRVGTDDLGGLLAALRQAGVPDPAPARA